MLRPSANVIRPTAQQLVPNPAAQTAAASPPLNAKLHTPDRICPYRKHPLHGLPGTKGEITSTGADGCFPVRASRTFPYCDRRIISRNKSGARAKQKLRQQELQDKIVRWDSGRIIGSTSFYYLYNQNTPPLCVYSSRFYASAPCLPARQVTSRGLAERRLFRMSR